MMSKRINVHNVLHRMAALNQPSIITTNAKREFSRYLPIDVEVTPTTFTYLSVSDYHYNL